MKKTYAIEVDCANCANKMEQDHSCPGFNVVLALTHALPG